MKLTAILLLAACLQVSARGDAQNVSISLHNATLEKVFQEIRKQTGFSFFYKANVLDEAKRVSVSVKNASIEEVLNICFNEQPLTYTIIEKTILVKKKEHRSPKEETTGINEPLPIDISGKVTDEDGNPLVGATVRVKGTSKMASTNESGVFVLKGVEENAVLEITFTEHQTMSIEVNNRTSIVVALKQEVASLQEVVINKGYYTEKQKYSVGNVGRVTAKEIERQNVNNPLLALQGRVPGLTVTQTSGLPGAGVVVRIQGQNSLQNGNSPLYVVDGVPIAVEIPVPNNSNFTPFPNSGESYLRQGYIGRGNVLSFLNPADIESIEILKDADATSIYGSRAANGAILITTKKGKSGKAKVDLNFQRGFSEVPRFMKMLNTQQYLEMRKEGFKNDGRPIPQPNLSATSNFDLTRWDSTRYTNWQQELLGTRAEYTDANINLSGGTLDLQYLFGGAYHKETSVFPGDFADERVSFHINFNNNNDLKNKFHFQISSNYAVDDNALPRTDLTETAITLVPNAPHLYNDDGTLNWDLNSEGVTTFVNPLAKLFYETYHTKTNQLIANANLSYDILPELKIGGSIGYTNLQSGDIQKNMLFAIRPERRNDPSYPRSAIYGESKLNTWNVEPQISYKKSFKKGLVDALIGTSFQRNFKQASYIYGEGFTSDQIMSNPQAAAIMGPAGYMESIYKYNAVYSRINYNYRRRYILNVTGRRDGSTRFGENDRFHNFWSVAGGWIFTEENFIANQFPFLSFGKLKASYGTTGSDQIGDYRFLGLFNNIVVLVPYQGTANLATGAIPNPFLQWEETKKLNIGIDFGLFNDRIFLSGNYSNNRSSNQFLEYNLPAITGRTDILTNLDALIENSNLEFVLRTENIRSKKVNWISDFNLTIARNKLVSFPDLQNSPYKPIYVVGQPVNVRKLYHYNGVDPATGLYTFTDIQGNPTSTPNETDANVLFTDFPKFYGGVQNSFQYGKFQLDFLFQFVKKNAISPTFGIGIWPGFFNSAAASGNQPIAVLNRWQKPGDNAEIQRFSYFNSGVRNSFNNARFSDKYFVDASYIRLKNVSLSYELPSSWVQRIYLNSFRFYAHIQNLLTITNYKGLDPETPGYSSLPPLRAITFGLQIKF